VHVERRSSDAAAPRRKRSIGVHRGDDKTDRRLLAAHAQRGRDSVFNPDNAAPITPSRPAGMEANMDDETRSARVVVSCSSCGNVRAATTDVTIRNCVDNDAWSYWFICPVCRNRAAANTCRRSAMHAIDAGSTLELWHLPAELDEQPKGPPISLIDLLELHLLFLEPNWVDNLA
jgi:hypothetical protein